MATLKTKLNVRADEFRANAELMRGLVADLREKTAEVARGGSEEARQKHLARGKLLPRDRINALVDPGCGDPRAVAARRVRHVRRRRAGGEHRHVHRPRRRAANA